MLPIHKVRSSVFNYDEIPLGYYFQAMQKGSSTQRFWHRKKFESVAKMIRDDEKVLDMGCGPGSFLYTLGETKKNVTAVGVDIASGQIEFAKREIQSKYPDERISFRTLTPGPMPFEAGTFDVVTCIEVIEHIHPQLAMKLLWDASRVLKPDGRLIITTPNYRSLWPLIEFALEKLSPVKYHEQHISKFTPNALVKFLEAGGFELVELETIFVLAPFLSGISPQLANLLNRLEKKLPLRPGSLLIAECRKVELDGAL